MICRECGNALSFVRLPTKHRYVAIHGAAGKESPSKGAQYRARRVAEDICWLKQRGKPTIRNVSP